MEHFIKDRIKRYLLLFILCLLILWGTTKSIYITPKSVDGVKDFTNIQIEEMKNALTTNYMIDASELAKRLGLDYSITYTITSGCSHFENYAKCVGDVLGVSSAESSMFKKCGASNGCFAIMYRDKTSGTYKKRSYKTIEESILSFLQYYEDKKRYLRYGGQARLDGKYCTSACTYWVKNYEIGYANVKYLLDINKIA